MTIFDKKTSQPLSSEEVAKRVAEYNQKFLASQAKAEVSANVKTTATQTQRSNEATLTSKEIYEKFGETTKNTLQEFVFNVIDDGPEKDTILTGFNGLQPKAEMLEVATRVFQIFSTRVTDPNYTAEDAQADTQTLKSIIRNESMNAPYISTMISEYPFYLMGIMADFLREKKGLSPQQASETIVEQLMPLIDNLMQT
jgi:hypothetical protein